VPRRAEEPHRCGDIRRAHRPGALVLWWCACATARPVGSWRSALALFAWPRHFIYTSCRPAPARCSVGAVQATMIGYGLHARAAGRARSRVWLAIHGTIVLALPGISP
jgi:hypothetical protein